jgi:hypothetical protein
VPEPGMSVGFDRYAYVNNNPISFNDPSGKYVCQLTRGNKCYDQYSPSNSATYSPAINTCMACRATSTPTLDSNPRINSFSNSTPTPPLRLSAGASPTPTPTVTSTPSYLPTLTHQQKSTVLTVTSKIVDIAEKAKIIRLPFVSIGIDIWAQKEIDEDAGYLPEYKAFRVALVVTQGQLISAGSALVTFGAASLGSVLGPTDYLIIVGVYSGVSSLGSVSINYINQKVIFPLIEENINAYQ